MTAFLKSKFSSFILLFFTFSAVTAWAGETPTLYEQLCGINKEWQTKDCKAPLYGTTPNFESDEDLIQTHLKLVEQTLRQKDVSHLTKEARKMRFENLDVLKRYWQRGLFPKNLYHDKRTPYFIDDYGTACAVGFLVIESGHEAFASTIHQENNYAYIAEVNQQFPMLKQWANTNGFTVDELAWIQPTYSCTNGTCATGTQRNVSCYGMCAGCAMPDPASAGMVAPYTYNWDDPSGMGCDLCPGTWNCTVTDGIGAVQVFSFTITEPPMLGFTNTSTPSTCSNPNGSACVSVFGGCTPYLVLWDDSAATVGSCISNAYGWSL